MKILTAAANVTSRNTRTIREQNMMLQRKNEKCMMMLICVYTFSTSLDIYLKITELYTRM